MDNATFVVLLLVVAGIIAAIKWNKDKEPLRGFFAWLNKNQE